MSELKNTTKAALAAALGALCAYGVQLLVPVLVLVVVMLLDYATGMAKAWNAGELSSRVGLRGILKKVGYVATVGVAAVVLTISSKLSGTYQSACIAAADYDNVYVVDSGTAAIGTGILAEYALTCIDRGMDAAALVRELTEKREDVCVLALVDTLEYLKRGGRISKTTALAGGLLNIKPVLTIEKGEILLIGKARGSRQGNNLLVEKIRACGGIDFQLPILLGYTGLTDVFLKKYVEDSRALWENGVDGLESTLIGGVIGTHAGPGAIAVAFFRRG